MEHNELISQLNALSTDLPPMLQREVAMVLHKITHPMKDIIAMVPGTSLTERAKRLKVSRQTLYVWISEKYRPTKVQAKRIARVTGVPIEHILDDGFEGKHEAGRKARKKTARVATKRGKTTSRDRGVSPKRRRKAQAGNRSEAA